MTTALRKKREVINLGGIRFLVIDLTEPLKGDIEVYPGDPKPKRRVVNDFDKSGFKYYTHEIGDHLFHPHVDAPNHQNPDMRSRGIEFYDIRFCFNSACLIDLSNSVGVIGSKRIRWLIKVEEKHLQYYLPLISTKRALLIRTGYDRWIEANKPHNKESIPHLTKGAGKMLARLRNIRVVGIDSLSIDAPNCHYVHQKLKDKLIVESLVNLYSIPKKSRFYFDLQTSPISIVGATGGPIAAYAFVKID